MTAGIGAGVVHGAQGWTHTAALCILTESEDQEQGCVLKSSRLQDGTFVLLAPREVQAT